MFGLYTIVWQVFLYIVKKATGKAKEASFLYISQLYGTTDVL